MWEWIQTHSDADSLLSFTVLAVTAWRWWYDRQLAKSLDMAGFQRKLADLGADMTAVRVDVTTMDGRLHRLGSEKLPALLKEQKTELVNYMNREVQHLKELFQERIK